MYTRCIVVGGGLKVWQQLSGINGVMYFGPQLMQKIGFGDGSNSSLLLESLPLTGMNAIGTIVAIIYIDRLGRRAILLWMVPFIAVSHLFIAGGLALKGYGNGTAEGNHLDIHLT